MQSKLAIALDGTKSIRAATFPQDITQLRSFLGACNVYRKFVNGFYRIARTLNKMVGKDAEPDWLNPLKEELEGFKALKEALITPAVLALPKKDGPYMVDTDASKYTIGAVILQQQDEKNSKEGVPVEYWSKTFTQPEAN